MRYLLSRTSLVYTIFLKGTVTLRYLLSRTSLVYTIFLKGNSNPLFFLLEEKSRIIFTELSKLYFFIREKYNLFTIGVAVAVVCTCQSSLLFVLMTQHWDR